MNNTLSNFARVQLKEGLAKLGEKEHIMFKRIYSHGNLELDINEVVNKIPEEKLDWAMQQVENTLKKRGLVSNEAAFFVGDKIPDGEKPQYDFQTEDKKE